jgi:hypothetical protein
VQADALVLLSSPVSRLRADAGRVLFGKAEPVPLRTLQDVERQQAQSAVAPSEGAIADAMAYMAAQYVVVRFFCVEIGVCLSPF